MQGRCECRARGRDMESSISREATPSGMVLTVTEDTPADMLAGSMELLVQLPRDHQLHTQRVTVQRSTPMMDLLVQIATAHKLAASSYTLQAIGERGLVLPHQPNTPIGALDALQVKLLPKQGTFVPRKTKQAVQPFETTFRLQVHLPRNQLYVSRVSPKMNLGEILAEVCREKNLDRNKYELRHPANLEETLDLSLSLRDYHLQEVTLYAKQGRTLGSALSSQDIMALQRQEERRRQQAKQSVFGFMLKKSKESSLSTDSLGGRSVSPARSDETARSGSPLQPPARPQRKRRPAPKPPVAIRKPDEQTTGNAAETAKNDADPKEAKDKMVISHSRNSSDSSGYHEASVLSDNPDSAGRLPETLPRRTRGPTTTETSRKLAHTSQSSKSLGNLAATSGTLSRGISSTSLSSTGQRKKRAAPPPPVPRPLSSAVSTQALERIVDSEESLTSDMDPSKPPSDIGAPSKASSDIEDRPKASSDIGVTPVSRNYMEETVSNKKYEATTVASRKMENDPRSRPNSLCKNDTGSDTVNAPVEEASKVETGRVTAKREPAPVPKPRRTSTDSDTSIPPVPPKRRVGQIPSVVPRTLSKDSNDVEVDFTPSPSSCAITMSQNHTDTVTSRNRDNVNDRCDPPRKNVEEIACVVRTPNKIDDPNDRVIDYQQTPMEREIHSDLCGNNNINAPDTFNQDPNTSPITNLPKSTHKIKLPAKSTIEENYKINACTLNENNNVELDHRNRSDRTKETNDGSNKSDVSAMQIAKTTNDACNVYSPTKKENSALKFNHVDDKTTMCSVISTIPKCDHLDIGMDHRTFMNKHPTKHHDNVQDKTLQQINKSKYNMDNQSVSSQELHSETDADSDGTQTEQNGTTKKKAKIFRSQSKFNDFETDVLKKQRRHLTSHSEDITFAMNLNVSSENLLSFEEFCNGIDGRTRQEKIGDITTFYGTKGLPDADDTQKLTETDILLQKVSDTLSNSLPISSSSLSTFQPKEKQRNEKEISIKNIQPSETKKSDTVRTETKSEAAELEETKTEVTMNGHNGTISSTGSHDLPDASILKASTPNITVAFQQDTSDYVSAVSDDLSLTDWEYQLPAPPSAFRDSDSPVYDGYDTITLGSVEAFKEPEAEVANQTNKMEKRTKISAEPIKRSPENLRKKIPSNTLNPRAETLNDHNEKSIERETVVKQITDNEQSILKRVETSKTKEKSANSKETFTSEANINLKKEIIDELESKIETGTLAHSGNKENENRRTIDRSAKIAPIDNTLSNFTITTYKKQTSLNIFEENEDQNKSTKNSNERTIKTFATLSRNKSDEDRITSRNCNVTPCILPSDDKNTNDNIITDIANGDRNINSGCKKVEPKSYDKAEALLGEPVHAGNEKVNIHRSKSHITMGNNEKYVGTRQEENEDTKRDIHNSGMRRATSITSLNVGKNNEKFSQWRENILKRQEEVTKEKQLQSLQVLKSILPQLKNAQQAEENVSKEYNNASSHGQMKTEIGSSEHSIESNAVSTRESRAAPESERDVKRSVPKESNAKRYMYTGPPAISLGSWSERPCVNVQIKVDTDYKFDRNSAVGSKTVVNINGTDEKKDQKHLERNGIVNDRTKSEASVKFSEKNGLDELAKKVISHTTAAGFKKPTKINIQDSKLISKNEERPTVTAVELKRTNFEKAEEASNDDEVKIDTSSVSFKDLTRAFGQDVCLRPKPKRINVNRHSDYYNAPSEMTHDSDRKLHGIDQNKSSNRNDQTFKSHSLVNTIQNNLQAKRYTSVVGIHSQHQNSVLQNGNPNAKINGGVTNHPPLPVVKGFKLRTTSTDAKANNVFVNRRNDTVDSGNRESTMPKPPTMPVITGVTLKSASARPKSMPVHVDSRDILLESIRNFGGREKLKSVRTLT